MLVSHIFCGQISTSGAAQGLHSQTAGSNYPICATADQCTYYTDGNGYCKVVSVRNNGGVFVSKQGGSSMFSKSMTTTSLTTNLQTIANRCRKTSNFCATGCNYSGNSNTFNIFFKIDNYGNIVSAYPQSSCTTNVCANQCKDLK